MFRPVDSKISLPELEEKTISYWKANKTFEKSVEKNPADKTWNFLDGPPFVTGLPHYGHLLTSIAKDIFPRFKTMQGYRVRRVWGWDGHGLPVENKVENKLEVKRKKDIEDIIGVDTFIQECKKYVNQISGEWEWYIDHIARWVDFGHAYKTWDTPYMESVMWVFKQMYEKDLIYKGLRVSLYCPHCSTPISNFEVAMDADNYKELVDPTATYKYKMVGDDDTYILAWSTTPWNKLVTPALAVNPKLTYVKVKQGDEYYILAKNTIKMLNENPAFSIVAEYNGSQLVGKKFEPHYAFYKIASGEKGFEIISGDFVTAEEGTGVVTIAAYGEEDLKVMKEQHVHIEMHLDEEGTIKPYVPQFGGMYYLKANKFINEDLEKRGLVYKTYEYLHSVPLCWRCHTRLYYAPQNAWFVNVQKLKPELIASNEQINWFPEHFKHGRFLKSLENAPDWNISRNRYWGSPVPVWECECGSRFVPGSIKELEEASGQKIHDLHKPDIDQVTVTCKECGKKVKRVSEVLDSWIEAGSAEFAERHYPFNTSEKREQFFPSDFIVEYTGQIRAWFYVLHVIANAIYDSIAFKNVLVNGVIMGTDGRKMSKNFGNYPDPKELIQKYGGDALRLYLAGSPVMRGEDVAVSEEQYRNQVRGTLLILWNVYNFFVTYANIDSWKYDKEQKVTITNNLDEWIEILLDQLIVDITNDLESYNTISAVAKLQSFVTDFSTWYIRRSRDRVGPTATDREDKEAFYQTTYHVLTTLCKVAAPLIPFITEEMYRNLTGEESVHLTSWPEAQKRGTEREKEMVEQMKLLRQIVEKGLAQRKEKQIKVRQPLAEITITNHDVHIPGLEKLIIDELNVKKVSYTFTKDNTFEVFLDTNLTPQLQAEGQAREIIRSIQEERKKLGTKLDDRVDVTLSNWPQSFEDYIKQQALVNRLERGSNFKVALAV